MGYSFIPVCIFTLFWGLVGIVLPFFVPKGTNRGILQVVLMLTAFTCWLSWLVCYMAQMNPLIGPKLSNTTLLVMKAYWDFKYTTVMISKPPGRGQVYFDATLTISSANQAR